MKKKKTKKIQTYRTIKDARDWKKMDGDTDLEKKVNSYLTGQFIIYNGVPSDECLDEAKHLVKMISDEKIKVMFKALKKIATHVKCNELFLKGKFMNSTALQLVNGFVFGFGLVLASVVFKLLFHTGLCG